MRDAYFAGAATETPRAPVFTIIGFMEVERSSRMDSSSS
jgi:hypothetical protein